MKAILLAAGFGSRLKPLTNKIPKCLVPIKGKPLLEIWLENLSKAKINSYLINTHYLSEQVLEYIRLSKFTRNCIVKHEINLLGTAGTLLANLEFVGNDDCILIHADNYFTGNILDLIDAHKRRPANCLITMMIFQAEKPSECGIVELDKENVVIGFHEKIKNPPGNLANGAVYIISADLIKLFKDKQFQVSDFSTEVLNNLLGKIFTFKTNETFIDIGTPEAYLKANSI